MRLTSKQIDAIRTGVAHAAGQGARVHEYIENLAVISSALRSGHAFAPVLMAAATPLVPEIQRLHHAK